MEAVSGIVRSYALVAGKRVQSFCLLAMPDAEMMNERRVRDGLPGQWLETDALMVATDGHHVEHAVDAPIEVGDDDGTLIDLGPLGSIRLVHTDGRGARILLETIRQAREIVMTPAGEIITIEGGA